MSATIDNDNHRHKTTEAMDGKLKSLTKSAIQLLSKLITTPSFSSEEDKTALLIGNWLKDRGIPYSRSDNNIRAINRHFDPEKPTILLNSHHDTVKPNKGYTRDPFKPEIIDGKLYGLGSNDAGGSLVALMAVFAFFYDMPDLKYNLILAATAEEESSGKKGLNSILNTLPAIDFAIVGEPTQMHLAISEKGLLIIDCYAYGTAGHAAHSNPDDNAIYKALATIAWFKNYEFEKISETLGKVKMTVSQIQAGEQHNVVPAYCHFVVDVRVNDCYTNREVLDIIRTNTAVEVIPRSLHLNASSIAPDHPIVKSGLRHQRTTYGSPTLSDQAVLHCPSLKMGPGDSLRSHTADEFIYTDEILEAVALYRSILGELL